jgi:ABC-type transporter Mla MlaB component
MMVLKMESNILTFATVHLLLKALKWNLSRQPAKDLILDLSDVAEVDSAGIALLIELKRWFLLTYQQKLLFRCSHQILQLLQFYELNDLLDMT